MEIILANHGTYPAASAAKARGVPDKRRGMLESDLDRALTDEILHEQEEAGLDLVTDGQVAWSDPVSPLLAPLDGVRLGGMERFLDTDRLFRRPVVTARLRHRAPILAGAYRFAALAARLPVKAVLTGPHTLANLCVLATTAYRSTAALAADLSMILREEILALVAAGARHIQIDEPLILARPNDIRLLREILEPLYDACAGRAALAVATYFADAAPLFAQLNSLPADIVSLDLVSSPSLAEAIALTGSSKVLALGLVDGRSARLEDPSALAPLLGRLLHRYVHDEVYIQPSCGLGGLRRSEATAKLRLLPAVRTLFAKGPA